MEKLTKEKVLKTIHLIDYGDYENSLLDFFEELNDLTLNVTQEEKETIIKFIKQENTKNMVISYTKISLQIVMKRLSKYTKLIQMMTSEKLLH